MSQPYHNYAVSKSAFQYIVYIYILFSFAITSKGTIMEIRSTRSFNAIPATLIRGVFKLVFKLAYEIYCKYFIYLFLYLLFPFLLTIVIFL